MRTWLAASSSARSLAWPWSPTVMFARLDRSDIVAASVVRRTLACNYSKSIAKVDVVAAEWGFLTNHARVLLCIAHDPNMRLRDIAATLGITERSAYAIVNDLTDAGYVLKERDGRRNRYIVQDHLPLPEATIRERTVGEVLDLLVGATSRTRTAATKRTTRVARSTRPRR